MSSESESIQPDVDPRTQRALTEHMTVIEEARSLFSVTTQSGSEYTVDLREPTCSCPDFDYRDDVEECKHIRRVRLEVGQIDVEELESELERTASELLRSAAQLESKAEDIYDQAAELEDARNRLLEGSVMSREETDVPAETVVLSRENAQNRPSITGSAEGAATAEQTVYRDRRYLSAPVGEEYTVTVNGDECLPKQYDLLSASPSGFSWGFSGSGPNRLSLAILAYTYNDVPTLTPRHQEIVTWTFSSTHTICPQTNHSAKPKDPKW